MRRPLFGDAADLEGRTSPITRAAGPRRGIINATPAIPTSSCGRPRVSSGRPTRRRGHRRADQQARRRAAPPPPGVKSRRADSSRAAPAAPCKPRRRSRPHRGSDANRAPARQPKLAAPTLTTTRRSSSLARRRPSPPSAGSSQETPPADHQWAAASRRPPTLNCSRRVSSRAAPPRAPHVTPSLHQKTSPTHTRRHVTATFAALDVVAVSSQEKPTTSRTRNTRRTSVRSRRQSATWPLQDQVALWGPSRSCGTTPFGERTSTRIASIGRNQA